MRGGSGEAALGIREAGIEHQSYGSGWHPPSSPFLSSTGGGGACCVFSFALCNNLCLVDKYKNRSPVICRGSFLGEESFCRQAL